MLAELLGYDNCVVLKGGLEEFRKIILNVQLPQRELTRDEQDTYQFRLKAASPIAALIKERVIVKRVGRRVKKFQGGCGVE